MSYGEHTLDRTIRQNINILRKRTTISISSTEPKRPTVGQIWVDISTEIPVVKVFSASGWVPASNLTKMFSLNPTWSGSASIESSSASGWRRVNGQSPAGQAGFTYIKLGKLKPGAVVEASGVVRASTSTGSMYSFALALYEGSLSRIYGAQYTLVDSGSSASLSFIYTVTQPLTDARIYPVFYTPTSCILSVYGVDASGLTNTVYTSVSVKIT